MIGADHSHDGQVLWSSTCPACNPPWPEMDRWEEETFGDE